MAIVTYDLAIWDEDQPADDTAAQEEYRQLYARYIRGKPEPPTPRIADYVRALLDRYPEIDTEAGELAGPNCLPTWPVVKIKAARRPPSVSGKRSRSLLDPLAWVRTLLRTPVIEAHDYQHDNGLRPQASARRDTYPCAGHRLAAGPDRHPAGLRLLGLGAADARGRGGEHRVGLSRRPGDNALDPHRVLEPYAGSRTARTGSRGASPGAGLPALHGIRQGFRDPSAASFPLSRS
jgi:hypothetical protein